MGSPHSSSFQASFKNEQCFRRQIVDDNQDGPGKFLEDYGRALGARDLDSIASCWGIPSLVISDQGALAVTDSEQVRQFFAQAVDWYHSQGWVEVGWWLAEQLSPGFLSMFLGRIDRLVSPSDQLRHPESAGWKV
jgi:hypothetical protein